LFEINLEQASDNEVGFVTLDKNVIFVKLKFRFKGLEISRHSLDDLVEDAFKMIKGGKPTLVRFLRPKPKPEYT
jgi:hypothetical protein